MIFPCHTAPHPPSGDLPYPLANPTSHQRPPHIISDFPRPLVTPPFPRATLPSHQRPPHIIGDHPLPLVTFPFTNDLPMSYRRPIPVVTSLSLEIPPSHQHLPISYAITPSLCNKLSFSQVKPPPSFHRLAILFLDNHLFTDDPLFTSDPP